MRKWIVQALMPVVCALSLLLGVIALGRGTRAALHNSAAYTVAFDGIECEPPKGMPRGDFLGEVRDLSGQPDRLHLLDEDLTNRLARAFGAHPWVESVRRVEVRNPKAKVRVELVYRQPILAVRLPVNSVPRDGSTLIETWSGKGPNAVMLCRAVDCNGVLLPVVAASSHLPVLTTVSDGPSGATGTYWGDRRVAAAAATVAYLKPHLARLGLNDCDVEIVDGEVIFRKPGVRVVWGRAPGREIPGEASAEVKLRRLLDYQKGHEGLDRLEHDVRLLAYQGHFPLFTDAQR